MYIPEFWCGVASAIIAEIAVIVTFGVCNAWRGRRR